jgi:hypothetical protein
MAAELNDDEEAVRAAAAEKIQARSRNRASRQTSVSGRRSVSGREGVSQTAEETDRLKTLMVHHAKIALVQVRYGLLLACPRHPSYSLMSSDPCATIWCRLDSGAFSNATIYTTARLP